MRYNAIGGANRTWHIVPENGSAFDVTAQNLSRDEVEAMIAERRRTEFKAAVAAATTVEELKSVLTKYI